ncbi:hypothetical protein LSTR_LSTR000068 [Laodelphax striatellus]|uniref:Uncharacterized protein n=1 Tax=Laodelphax striatellus TaxID=195883 RepID=A0A482X6F1_LAOST|nr:hypothetical protein LSTR_LSTR000068 [Laodelphax striatellus]
MNMTFPSTTMNSEIDIKDEVEEESLDVTGLEEKIDVKHEAVEELLNTADSEGELESRHEEEEGFHAIYFKEEATFEANRDDWATNIEAESLEDPLQLDEDMNPLCSNSSGEGLSGQKNIVEENRYVYRCRAEQADPGPTSPISSEIDSEEEFEPIRTNPSRVKNKDFCFYCRAMVLNFARHVEKNHAMEDEVQQILSCPRKSSRRKMLLAILTKKGNFLASQDGIIRPVRKTINDDKTFLPCPFCLGLYSSSLWYKHRKQCPLNPSSMDKGQAAELAMITSQFEADHILRETIFPSMRPDSITLAAQKDSLICEYGSYYLQTHVQEPQFIKCNAKMRQLSRVLISAQKMDSTIRNLIDALRPQNFKTLVAAAREEAGYNKVNNPYYSKSFAMNIGPLLKDCCEVAIYHVMETEFCFPGQITSELVKEFKQTILLMQSNWNIEFFHLPSPRHKNK